MACLGAEVRKIHSNPKQRTSIQANSVHLYTKLGKITAKKCIKAR